ncbi:hypothetical protein [Marivirga sp.]|uniref:hypothetical protein n=1 Tax=Marivirga sp. TaxID=2018662 RepID=UPI003DA70E76
MSRITYKYRSSGTKSNSWKIVALFGYWPIRSEIHKGYYYAKEFADRKMTQEEEKALKEMWRYTAFTYQSIEELLDDERMQLGKDHPFISELKAKFNESKN